MRILFIVFILFFSSASFAGGFTDSISSFFMSIWEYLTVDIPLFFQSLFVYILKYIVLAKIDSLIWFTEFAYSIAVSFIDNMNMTDVIQSSLGQLDSDIVQTLIDVRFFDCFQLIVEAFVARYILDFMKW